MTPRLIDGFRQLIALPSISSTRPELDQGNRAVIDTLAEWFNALGFVCDIQPLPGQPGKANLIATLGSGPGGLVLAGHTDTVPCDESLWRSDPFTLTEADNRLYGLGVCDMKGFFPLILEAIRDLKANQLQQPLIILATADEESSMNGARALAAEGKPKARYAVIGEPTGLQPLHMHKGIMMERLTIIGQSGHSSDPSLGRNAMEAMNQVINRILILRSEFQQRYNNPAFSVPIPTLNLGCIHGGDNPNRICGHCELEFDVRMLPGMNPEDIRREILTCASAVAKERGVTVSLEPLADSIDAFMTPVTSDLVKTCEQLTGYSATTAAFATEAPFLSGLGMETVVLGPGDIAQAHQPDEYLALDRITPTIDLLKQLITRYCL